MKIVQGEESKDIHNLYESVTNALLNAPVDSNMAISVMLKVISMVAVHQEWDKNELIQALSYTYDLEKFMNPTSKERH
jgi:hypothetical protein